MEVGKFETVEHDDQVNWMQKDGFEIFEKKKQQAT
jgi:hypothetical protein